MIRRNENIGRVYSAQVIAKVEIILCSARHDPAEINQDEDNQLTTCLADINHKDSYSVKKTT
jgi:hypothetical protein